MTETTQIRARYARIYAAGMMTLLAATVAAAAYTTNAPAQPAIDVSAIHSSVDTAALPVQGHVDAF